MDPLIEYIRTHSSPLDPVPTGEVARLKTFAGIKAVVFDIYGTILISAAGDISLAGGESSPERAMETALQIAQLEADDALPRYYELIRSQQDEKRKAGIEFPEVEIRDVWKQLIAERGGDVGQTEAACVAYECHANPVWPMPGLRGCIADLCARELTLGIVSNAQFYTPLLFPALLGEDLESLGFCPETSIFSYLAGEGKPSLKPYQLAAKSLEKKNIAPEEVLYIGNDRLKDVWPAAKVGFQTVLFAGDNRSLRWRYDDERAGSVEPDAVITGLDQIKELF